MPYIVNENFRYGLDTRRSQLASVPGTLITAANGHINSGGEFEKRKAFVRTARPANTFGLQATQAGLITFGSIADPGGWPIGGVSAYQRLQHPAVSVFGATYDGTKHAMTKVVFSRAYNGLAYVCATYADGFTFLFYNGTPVMNSYSGLILSGYTTESQRDTAATKDLANSFDTNDGWLPTVLASSANLTDTSGNVLQSTFIFTPSGVTFNYVYTEQTAAGSYGHFDLGSSTAVAGVPGTASFTVNGGSGTIYIIVAPSVYNENVETYLPTGSIPWAVSNNATAAAIASSINGRTVNHGFTAAAVGAVVTVTNPQLTFAALGTGSYTWGSLKVFAIGGDVNSTNAFSLSTTDIPAAGDRHEFAFGPTWAVGDTWSFDIVSTGGEFTVGRGNLGNGWWASGTVTAPSFALALGTRVYLGNGQQFNFSAVDDPTGYEQQDVGAGLIEYTSQFGNVDTVYSFAAYQGRLAVFGRRSVQIWQVDADPTAFNLQQTLPNIGTMAPFSTQSLGDLDVLFLADTGIRSLRVRDQSLNAFVNDLGSPIDSLVLSALLSLTDAQKATSCSIIEPTQNRYWLFVPNAAGTNGTIFVYSYFPTAKVLAWSTYLPTYSSGGVQTAFVPQKFEVFNGQVFACDASAFYSYGGSDGNTYDNCVATLQLPFFDMSKPAHMKTANGFDAVLNGTWTFSAGPNWQGGSLATVLTGQTTSTFDNGWNPYTDRGTHFTIKAQTTGSTAATISSVILHYSLDEAPQE